MPGERCTERRVIGWMEGQREDGWKEKGMNASMSISYLVLSIVAASEPKEEPPTQPILGELTAPHVTSDSVQLEWSVPEGTFDSFTVQYRDAQGQPQVLPVDGGLRTVTGPGLSPSRRYKFNLYGVWGRKRLGPVSTDAVTGEGASGHPMDHGFVVGRAWTGPVLGLLGLLGNVKLDHVLSAELCLDLWIGAWKA